MFLNKKHLYFHLQIFTITKRTVIRKNSADFTKDVFLPILKKCIFKDKYENAFEHVMCPLSESKKIIGGFIFTSAKAVKIGEEKFNTSPTLKAPLLEKKYPILDNLTKDLSAAANNTAKKSYIFFSNVDPRSVKELDYREKDKILFEIGCNNSHGLVENFKLEVSRLVAEICFNIYTVGSFKVFYQGCYMSDKKFFICTRDDLNDRKLVDPFLSKLVEEKLSKLDLMPEHDRETILLNEIEHFETFNAYGTKNPLTLMDNDDSFQ
uniref:Uncharacterized protein n=1 Tax=Oxytricha trifallax TaxID=1172189 RepID=G9HRJ6_9SPIT|nr:hypothetical protein [Oxytricha trifallax]